MIQKHILFIVENNSVPQDVRVWQEALAVKEFGYEVSVICPATQKCTIQREIIDGIVIYRHYCFDKEQAKHGYFIEYGNALFWEFILSLWIFIQKPFHTIHAANPPDLTFIIALFYRIFGVKYIFDHHDLSPEMYYTKFGRKDLLFRLLLLIEKINFTAAHLVISTNESYRAIAISRGRKRPDRVVVVRNGPILEKVIWQEPCQRLKEGFTYLVVYVGVIGDQEQLDNLLHAAHHIIYKKNCHHIKFIIVGRGPSRQAMVELSRRLKVSKYVEFTGYISYEDLYEILATADLCVNPEFRDSFTDKSTMIKLMDYMMFGKPIVQFYSKEGAVTAGDAAVYVYENDVVAFAEEILRVLDDSEKRIQMGKIGKQRIIDYLSWEKQKPFLKTAYENLERNEAC